MAKNLAESALKIRSALYDVAPALLPILKE